MVAQDSCVISASLSSALIGCRGAMLLPTSPGETSNAGCQTSDGLADEWEGGVSYLTREHLEHELQTSCLERNRLTAQLKECTKTFHDQLKVLTEKGNGIEPCMCLRE